MIRKMQKSWSGWMRVMTVTAAVLAIFVSAFALSPESDLRVLPAHSAAIFAAGANSHGAAQPASDTDCHIGYSCTLVIFPGTDLSLTRFRNAPVALAVVNHPPSVAADLPFHPPRILSQV